MPSKSRRDIRTGLPIALRKAAGLCNRRGEPRFRYATSVFLLNRANRYPATTIDVSSTGARIRLDRPVILDADGLFAAPSFGILVSSIVIWRHGLEIGVRFTAKEGMPEQEAALQSDFGRRQATRPDRDVSRGPARCPAAPWIGTPGGTEPGPLPAWTGGPGWN